MQEALLVMVGGAIGSVVRYLLGGAATQWFGPAFPIGIMVINISGSFVLGSVLALNTGTSARLFWGIGFCGGYTTFSTFSVETLALLEQGNYVAAAGYVLGSVLGGLAAAWAGFVLIRGI